MCEECYVSIKNICCETFDEQSFIDETTLFDAQKRHLTLVGKKTNWNN